MTKPNLHQPGKYRIIWDCTDNDIFNVTDGNEKLTIRVQAKGENGQIAYAQKDILLKETVENAETDNFIIINNAKIFASDILARHQLVRSRIPKSLYSSFSKEGKFIVDHLPIIMVKIGFLHGAYFQVHWLEGSAQSIELPYDTFMSEKRVEGIDRKNLESYMKDVKYLSEENLGYSPSNPDAKQLFLYNENLESVRKSLKLFIDNLAKTQEDKPIGDYQNLVTRKGQPEVVKENYFQSFSIGSERGNIDDIGTAFGQIFTKMLLQRISY